MSEREFLQRAEALLLAVEQCCDRINAQTDADIDAQRVDGMVTLVFANGSQIVINWQKPLREVWLAASAGGFHYRFDAQRHAWLDTRGGGEFFAMLGQYASAQAGMALDFSAGARLPSGA